MSNKIRLGILGGGGDSLIGVVHRIASNMFDRYQLVGGCFNPNIEDNNSFAERIGIPLNRVYASFDILIEEELKLPAEERMEVISVLTPNFLHFPMAKKLLENGFNVICEKPLTTSYAEALELEAIQKEKQAVFAVTYTYTGYPMVRQMKDMIRRGVLGAIQTDYTSATYTDIQNHPEIEDVTFAQNGNKVNVIVNLVSNFAMNDLNQVVNFCIEGIPDISSTVTGELFTVITNQ